MVGRDCNSAISKYSRSSSPFRVPLAPTAEQTAVMEKAWEAATAGQGEEEEQEDRGKRARKPKSQAEVPAKSSKKKGSPKKKGK